ncbi:MAG: S8 family serine peptidase [Stappiaceae bacterium]
MIDLNKVSAMTLFFKPYRRLPVIAFFLLLAFPLVTFVAPMALPGFTALADDDDDDDDDDAGSGGGSTSGGSSRTRDDSSGGEIIRFLGKKRKSGKRVIRRQARVQVVRQSNVPNEIVALGLSQAQLRDLIDQGYEVLQSVRLELLDTDVLKLQVPAGTGLEQARALVGNLNPQALVDFNHYYRPETSENSGEATQVPCRGNHCAAWQMVGWPTGHAALATCSSNIRIGLIDTGINAEHAALSEANLEVRRLENDDRAPSGRQHGTAVAVMLAGAPGSRSPGLLPSAEIFAVDAFHRGRGKDDRGDVFEILQAMDYLAQKSVSVINMSLAGPENVLLKKMVERLSVKDVILVAAVGNGGRGSKNMYPAAYPTVIAVTAVDRHERIFRRAVQGEHVDFAAPGVNVWTAASVRGARSKTGTSFAAPFVTAVVAIAARKLESADAEAVRKALAASSRDLGGTGRDPVFGYGLIQGTGLCP